MRLLAVVVTALALAPAASAEGPAAHGQDLYFANCAWCHGLQLQGVEQGTGPGNRPAAGPPLAGVGALATDFYLRMGYMPLQTPRQQPQRSRPHFGERDIRALVAFVGSHGGPGIPTVHPERGNVSTGMQIFTEHCAGCHQIVAEGGIVTGARVPSLKQATAREVAQAVRVGPYVMPRFNEHDISRDEMNSLVRYVLYTQDPHDRGGWSLLHVGPIPEGIVAWLIAGIALLVVARLIGEGHKA
jgi:ubiquinol-cytochrome c reductase cytochrome c subunit